ncbi:acyltransferase family protein [Halomonas sp. DP8Y7-3]|uniref:acyltransferase family protein n=1 Tax=Halomonas sp. DP8Y7-3 TaxID=2859079 RepID=UPI001C944A46|nr:acyltransferase family protein [Halomonas sp. DP8Y7-3]MBY5930791.1 acyltransferase family protein [Halomonas sp. DP8Y7-3]
MDLLRGTAILLVVYLHGAASLSAKYPNTWSGFGNLAEILTPFRMPVLMFLSGLLVIHSINKGARHYFKGKAQHILYPYVVWTLVMFGLYELREAMLGKEGRELFASLFYQPIDYLWFLYYLMVYYVLAFVALSRGATLGLVATLAIYAAGYLSDFSNMKLAFYLVIFMVGGWWGVHLPRLVDVIQRMPWILAVVLLAFGAVVFGYYIDPFNPQVSHAPLSLAASLAVIPSLLKIAMWWPWRSIAAPLEWIGRHSLPIFLVHVPVTLAVPVALVKLYDGDPDLLMPFYLVGVLAISMLVAWVDSRSRWASLLFSAKLRRGREERRQAGATN